MDVDTQYKKVYRKITDSEKEELNKIDDSVSIQDFIKGKSLDYVKEFFETYLVNVDIFKVDDKHYYVKFKYKCSKTPKSKKMFKQCRGITFQHNSETLEWIIVAYPFDRFFNYHEKMYVDNLTFIDSSGNLQIRFEEKFDGSIITAWYAELLGKWVYSSNTMLFPKMLSNMINHGLSKLISKGIDLESKLDKSKTYMFEVSNILNKIKLSYDDGLFACIGCRDNKTLLEERVEIDGLSKPRVNSEIDPKFDSFLSEIKESLESSTSKNKQNDILKGVIEFVRDMVGFEGVVVVDKNFKRIKIKSDWYLSKNMESENNYNFKQWLKNHDFEIDEEFKPVFEQILKDKQKRLFDSFPDELNTPHEIFQNKKIHGSIKSYVKSQFKQNKNYDIQKLYDENERDKITSLFILTINKKQRKRLIERYIKKSLK